MTMELTKNGWRDLSEKELELLKKYLTENPQLPNGAKMVINRTIGRKRVYPPFPLLKTEQDIMEFVLLYQKVIREKLAHGCRVNEHYLDGYKD